MRCVAAGGADEPASSARGVGGRRHRVPQAGRDVGRGRAAVLRGAGQGRQLPGRRVDPCATAQARARSTGGCTCRRRGPTDADADGERRRARRRRPPAEVAAGPGHDRRVARAGASSRRLVLADAAYGDVTEFRLAAWRNASSAYVLDVKGVTSALPETPMPETPPRQPGRGRPPAPRYRGPSSARRAGARRRRRSAAARSTWREGTRRRDDVAIRRPAGPAGERSSCDAPRRRQLPVRLAAGRMARRRARADQYWLSNLPADTPLTDWSAWPSSAGASSTTTAR